MSPIENQLMKGDSFNTFSEGNSLSFCLKTSCVSSNNVVNSRLLAVRDLGSCTKKDINPKIFVFSNNATRILHLPYTSSTCPAKIKNAECESLSLY